MKHSNILRTIGIGLFAFALVVVPRSVYAFEITDEELFISRLASTFDLSTSQVRSFLTLYKESTSKEKKIETKTYTNVKLAFINDRLSEAVSQKKLAKSQQRAIMDKIESMMKTAPSTKKFLAMSSKEQQAAINKWKKTMEAWCKNRGFSLADIREFTGKGNKYLMGIQF